MKTEEEALIDRQTDTRSIYLCFGPRDVYLIELQSLLMFLVAALVSRWVSYDVEDWIIGFIYRQTQQTVPIRRWFGLACFHSRA